MPASPPRPIMIRLAFPLLFILIAGGVALFSWASVEENREIRLHAIETSEGFEMLGGGMVTSEVAENLEREARSALGRRPVTASIVVRHSSRRFGAGVNSRSGKSKVLVEADRTDTTDLLVSASVGGRMITHRTGKPLETGNILAGLELSPEARRRMGLEAAEGVDLAAEMERILSALGDFFALSEHFGLAHMQDEIRRGGGHVKTVSPEGWLVWAGASLGLPLVLMIPYMIMRFKLRRLRAEMEREQEGLEMAADPGRER